MRRIVFCSGKVYYDLVKERRDRGINDVAVLRVEQLYPWPRLRVMAEISRYQNAEVIWCQEEPANMGGWMFVLPRLTNILDELKRDQRVPAYAGRKASASPATGLLKTHEAEQRRLVDYALATAIDAIPQPFRRPVS